VESGEAVRWPVGEYAGESCHAVRWDWRARGGKRQSGAAACRGRQAGGRRWGEVGRAECGVGVQLVCV
jgi:hypothetical protein